MLKAGDTKTLTVHSIVTSGGRKASASAGNDEGDGKGSISLAGGKVVLAGTLDASGGDIRNDNGERNRKVQVRGAVELDADRVSVTGGDVDVEGAISQGMKADPNDPNGPEIGRKVDLVFDANRLKLNGDAQLKSLDILARDTVTPGPEGDDAGVLFGGNIDATDFVHVSFQAAKGVVRWGTPADDIVTVKAPERQRHRPPSTGLARGRRAVGEARRQPPLRADRAARRRRESAPDVLALAVRSDQQGDDARAVQRWALRRRAHGQDPPAANELGDDLRRGPFSTT